MLNKKKIVAFLSILIFLVPFLFWGDYYQVGGDDSKLYYLFPWEYLRGFSLTFISDNQLGSFGNYFSQSYLAPFVFLIFVLKSIFLNINTQHLMFGLNLSLSFLFFYLLLGVFIKKKSYYSFLVKIISSLLYTFSIFSYYTVWSHQLFSVYLTAILPISLFLFSKSVLEKKIYYILCLNLVLFFSSATLYSIPWISAIFISILPILLFLFNKNRAAFIKHLFILIFLSILLNLHWIFPFVHAPFSSDLNNDLISTVSSEEIRASNINNIVAVSYRNELRYPLLGLFHFNLQRDFSWKSLDVFQKSYASLLLPNILFVIIVVLAYFYNKGRSIDEKRLYFSSLTSWLIALYFFSVKIGNWGLSLFLMFNDHLPGFTMFRNMYDKFGLSLAFTLSLLLAVSLSRLIENIKKDLHKKILLFIFLTLVIFNVKPFIVGSFYRLPYANTKNISNHTADFNQDFYDLLTSLKDLDSASNVVWFPLNTANYVFISDGSLENSYYMGVSPLQFLANTSDFNGLLSFKPEQSEYILNNLVEKNYLSIGKLFSQLGIEYLVKNNDIDENIQNSHFFSRNKAGDFFQLQNNSELENVLFGAKIDDFGDRYSLYEINPKFRNKKIYLTSDLSEFSENYAQLNYNKLNSYKYEIEIYHLDKKTNLVFLDPYHKQWEIYADVSHDSVVNGPHDVVFNYANGWKLDPDELINSLNRDQYIQNDDGSINLNLILYFKPHRYLILSAVISLVSLTTVIALFIYLIKKNDK